MIKRIRKITSLCFMLLIAPFAFSAGYPVFDVEGWLADIDTLYETYDMVNNTITQIENQYKQIQQQIERAKSIDWENVRFDGDFDIRNDIQDAGKRVNKLLSCANNIKKSINTPSIKCGNVKYSIADLCGMTSPEDGLWENRKNLLTAMTDYKDFMTDNMKKLVTNLTEGLTPEQKRAIWKKYGISPENYTFIQNAHTDVLHAASNILANCAEVAKEGKFEEACLRNSELIKAACQSVDSDGNITEASMQETMMYLFGDLSGHFVELENAMYNCASMTASKMIEDDAKEVTKENTDKQLEEFQDNKDNKLDSRFIKE